MDLRLSVEEYEWCNIILCYEEERGFIVLEEDEVKKVVSVPVSVVGKINNPK